MVTVFSLGWFKRCENCYQLMFVSLLLGFCLECLGMVLVGEGGCLLTFVLYIRALFISTRICPIHTGLASRGSFSVVLLPSPRDCAGFSTGRPLFRLRAT